MLCKVAVIDGMAVVHAMGKPTWIKTCANWADHFIATLESKVKEYEEIHLVFDRYDLPISLKVAMRQRRQGDRAATGYRVDDNTPVEKVSAKQFLSSVSTKNEFTVYLTRKALHQYEGSSKIFFVTSRQDVFSNCMNAQHLVAPKEADTKIILHSLDAVQRGATELHIHSPDTNVFVTSPILSTVQKHILHHWCGKQEVANTTGTNSACTWHHKNCSITWLPCFDWS